MTDETACWLLSAYRADSHGAWADWLQTSVPQIAWHCLELPGRHFRWRIRGNPLSWLDRLPTHTPDLILATSMVDLATLRGLHPRLAHVPAIYYFHENQFAYPVSDKQVRSIEPQMVQLYGALAAQQIVFNSKFNRDSFLAGVDGLLKKMPDAIPLGVRRRLERKAAISPVPITPVKPAEQRDEKVILWNHRWEYDKDPDLFAAAMIDLADKGVEFRLALLGARPEQTPGPLAQLRRILGDRIIADGRLPATAYREVLATAAIAVSTARHEFQGLAMMEAASAGARPLVPDSLCYPEQYTAPYRYPADDRQALVQRLHGWLTEGLPPQVDVSAWYEATLIHQWRKLLTQTASAVVDLHRG